MGKKMKKRSSKRSATKSPNKTKLRNVRSRYPRSLIRKGKALAKVGFKVLINLKPTWPRGVQYAAKHNWDSSEKLIEPIYGNVGKGPACREIQKRASDESSTPTKNDNIPGLVGSPKFPLPPAKASSSGDAKMYYRQLCATCGSSFGKSSNLYKNSPILKCGITNCQRLFVHAVCVHVELSGRTEKDVKEFCKQFIRCKTHTGVDDLPKGRVKSQASKDKTKKQLPPQNQTKKQLPKKAEKKKQFLSESEGSVGSHSKDNEENLPAAESAKSLGHSDSEDHLVSPGPSRKKQNIKKGSVADPSNEVENSGSNSEDSPDPFSRSPPIHEMNIRLKPMSSTSSSSSSSNSDPDFQKTVKYNKLSRKKNLI